VGARKRPITDINIEGLPWALFDRYRGEECWSEWTLAADADQLLSLQPIYVFDVAAVQGIEQEFYDPEKQLPQPVGTAAKRHPIKCA